MCPDSDWRTGLCVVVLTGVLAQTQAAVPQADLPESSQQWKGGVLELSVDGALWAQAIPFKALADSPVYRKRFRQSVISAQNSLRPDGPSRMAHAQYKGQTWLRWGEGAAPLALDVAGGWPYRLIAHRDQGTGQVAYRWMTADTRHTLTVLPDAIQKVSTPDGVWCAWLTVTGSATSSAGMADGRVPRIRWMLWRPGPKVACR